MLRNQDIQNITDLTFLPQPIVFFDGECNLCHSTVQFLLRNNPSGDLRFARLQSELCARVLKLTGNQNEKSDTLLFVKGNTVYESSTAAIKISAHLDFPFRLSGVFILIPKKIRDFVYKIIAKYRYSWFGIKTNCDIEENKYSTRFII